MSASTAISQLLRESRGGNAEAMDQLVPIVYQQLNSLASRFLRGERPGHTLSPTALVHEAYIKLVQAEIEWVDRGHFFKIAARTMRQILVDHAKTRHRAKRGGNAQRITLDDGLDFADARSAIAILELNEALTLLAVQDQRLAQVIELFYFGGLTAEEIARTLNVSPATVNRDLKMGRAWLENAMRSPE
jgi:RNA polymerase sigma factor (TIGR02999 family)